jgi:hypothetical protein
MTENQQRIIDSLVAEFNSRNEAKSKRPFKLIDVDEFDAINQRHIQLTADAEQSRQSWNTIRNEYINQLIEEIKEDIGDRLCVKRGNEAMNNHNYSDYIFIYKYNTPEHYIWERALRVECVLIKESRRDDVTREYYDYYTGFQLRGMHMQYEQEMDFFNCQYTKDKLKELLS